MVRRSMTGARRLVGMDDAHIDRDRFHEGADDPEAALRLGVMHAPYHRVVDRMVADGFGLVLAGHTHGGQLRVPGVGALVTNCDLDPDRARGLSEHVGRPVRAGARLRLAARLGRAGHLAVRAGALRLPARGDASHLPPALSGPSAGHRGSPALDARLACRHLGVWRSLVARFVRDEEVVGSNPATPTGGARPLVDRPGALFFTASGPSRAGENHPEITPGTSDGGWR